MSQLILLSFVVVLDTDHHRVLIPRLKNLAQGDGIALVQSPFTLFWSCPKSSDGQLFLCLRVLSCEFSKGSTHVVSAVLHLYEVSANLWDNLGKLLYLVVCLVSSWLRIPWSLGLTSTDRNNVLAKSQLAGSLPQKYGKKGDWQI